MSAISASQVRQLFALTADFYARGINCPPLVALNKWTLAEMASVEAPAPPARPAAAPASSPQGLTPPAPSADEGQAPAPAAEPDGRAFDVAVKYALASSPNGTSTTELRETVRHLGKGDNAVPGSLGRLKRSGDAEKRGELWHYIGPALPELAPFGNGSGGEAPAAAPARPPRNRRRAEAPDPPQGRVAPTSDEGGDTVEEAA